VKEQQHGDGGPLRMEGGGAHTLGLRQAAGIRVGGGRDLCWRSLGGERASLQGEMAEVRLRLAARAATARLAKRRR
jgi:hypothetical protein